MKHLTLLVLVLAVAACEDAIERDFDGVLPGLDSGVEDGGPRDGGDLDSSVDDTGLLDGSSGDLDTDLRDADVADGGDSGDVDAGSDAGDDAEAADSGVYDSGTMNDSGSVDMGGSTDMGNMAAGDCISGATGTHAVRYEWRGNGPNSRAYVGYEQNELPDTSRWKAGAYGRSFSYTPTFGDTFLGIGGLIFSGTTFMDVELSTVGLSSIRTVTIAILGRSYNTTTSGSFSWMTFDGSGAAPSGLVANSAPYQWYGADATSAFVPGNGSILLRIEPGGPSNSLVVNTVELCFDAN